MKIALKTIPLGQKQQLCLDLMLQEDEIKLQDHLVRMDEGAGEGNENNTNSRSCLGQEGTNMTNAAWMICTKGFLGQTLPFWR